MGPPASVAPITAPITSPLQNEHPQPQKPVTEVPPAATSSEPPPARKVSFREYKIGGVDGVRVCLQSGAVPSAPVVDQKPPIPQEYATMIQAFEAMMKRCRGVASNLVKLRGTRRWCVV